MRAFFGLAAVAVALVAPAGGEEAKPKDPADEAWKLYASKEGQFSVRFPSPPKEETRTGGSGARVQFVSAHVPGLDFSVNFTDLPEEVRNIPAGNVIDGVRNRMVRATGGKLVEDRYIELKPHQGREIRIVTRDKSTTLLRVYLVRNRLYQLRVLALAEQFRPEGVARFFDSFKLARP